LNLAKLPHLNKSTAGKGASFIFCGGWGVTYTYDTASICPIIGMAKPTEQRSRGPEHRRGWMEDMFRYMPFMQKIFNAFVTKEFKHIFLGNQN
jgi:hypothetical protein